jgi:hypothetical protein
MDAGKSEKQQRKTNTSKPICAEEACPFTFNVHWFDEFGRWGLKATVVSVNIVDTPI